MLAAQKSLKFENTPSGSVYYTVWIVTPELDSLNVAN